MSGASLNGGTLHDEGCACARCVGFCPGTRWRSSTAATRRCGVQAFPLSDVKAYMGHADISTTMIYVHHVPQVDAADRLSRLVAVSDAATVCLAEEALS